MPKRGERGTTQGALRRREDALRCGEKTGAKMDGRLTEREEDVARLLMKGVSNKEIARALGIALVTVKGHVGKICRKLGARNRTQAALALAEWAERGGGT